MREELPGIVKRLVLALKARHARGRFLQADQNVQEEFARQSDRVRMFLSECTRPGDRSSKCIKRADLYPLFCDWLREETDGKGKAMGKQKFNAKVRAAGVEEFKPKDCPFLWDLLRIDPETVEAEPFKTVDPANGANGLTDVGDDEAAFDSSDPKVSTESVNAEITSEQGVLPLSAGGSKTLSTVSPYPTPHRKEDQKFPQTSRWVESVETVDLEPYRGLAPTGIVYISQEEDLPDLGLLPKSVGFDLETFNRRTDLWRHKASLSPSLGGEIRLAQISDGTTTWIIDVGVLGQPAIEWLRSLTRDPERMLVGHNLLFEATFLIAAGIRPLCRWWDTMLACQIIGDLPSNSLASASAHYLKKLLDKAEQTSDWGGPLTASQLRYAALDAVIVLELGRVLHTELHNTGQVEAHRLDCQMICPCADGQVRGLAVDLDAASRPRSRRRSIAS